jgi:phosphomannomutase
MQIEPTIFKAYDIRGKVGTELTPEVSERVGRAMAQWLPAQGAVAVGRDMRPDSSELADAAIRGLIAGGRDIIDIGEVTSDMIYFAVGDGKLAGGVMITASHNPGEYNGIKLCAEEAKPMSLEGGLGVIRELVITNQFTDAEKPGTKTEKNITEGWINHVLRFIDPTKLTPMKLAVDAGNGMAGAIFPTLEKHVPWQVTELYFELDGTFPNHEANPLKYETLTDLIALIKEKGLDGGIAFDGDGDRAFLIDETGEVVSGGATSALLAEYFLHEFPGSHIVYDARNSHTVPEVIEASGGIPTISRVGHSLIKQKMREVDAPFGGEASGHFFFRDNWYADSGLLAAVIGLYVATLSGKKLSEIRTQYSHYEAIPETNFTVEDKDGAIARIKAAFRDGQEDELDGISIFFPDKSWFNVRPSNTEPTLRLNVEAKSKERLSELVTKVINLITQSK